MVFDLKDERGASTLEVAILLPLAILLVVGGFEIWKLMMLKRALYIGAYQSARYFANYERSPFMGVSERETRARRFILSELEGTRLYSADMPLEKVTVRLDAQGLRGKGPQRALRRVRRLCRGHPARTGAYPPLFRRLSRGSDPARAV